MLLTIVFGALLVATAIYVSLEAKILLGYWFMRRELARPQHDTAPQRHEGLAPSVTVQLPIYNEGPVAVELIRAVSAFDYPREQIDIQVLDDSTDATSALVAAEVSRLQQDGYAISHIRRGGRSGWKAGALEYGCALSKSEFVAVFDADFVPTPDYLRRILLEGNVFDNPKVAYLQGRWTYNNEQQNLLTRAQAILLDRHFIVQKPYLMSIGGTTVLNGSAVVLRRAAIDAVGGWKGDTLCEDLDLSYRCALNGWVGVYEKTVSAPSEIPADILAFRLQQRRWAKGSAQCLRKLTGKVLSSSELKHRWDDMYFIGGYAVHLIFFGYAVLWPLVVLHDLPWPMFWAAQMCLALANVVALSGFVMTSLEKYRKFDTKSLRDVLICMVLGTALTVNNSIAFVVGLFGWIGVFERTPKQGSGQKRRPQRDRLLHWGILIEIAFTIYQFWSVGNIIAQRSVWMAVPGFVFGGCMLLMICYQLLELFPKTLHSFVAEAGDDR